MKTQLFFLVSILFLISCAQKKAPIEIIKNYDVIYAGTSNSFAKPMRAEISKSVSQKIIKLLGKTTGTVGVYTLFVNETGGVDKVRKETLIKKNGEKFEAKNADDILKTLIPEIEKWKFEPAEKEGNPVKSKLQFELIRIPESNSIKLHFRKLMKTGDVQIDKGVYFVAAEEMPKPIGGVKAIQARVSYPDLARRAGIQGRVFVKAYIDEEGNVVKTEIIKGIGGGCDEAAQKAVEETKFVPGKQRGKTVKVQAVVPILFQLDANVKFFLIGEEAGSKPDAAEIKGSVIDTNRNLPVIAGNISLAGTRLGAATDEKGNFVIKDIPPGKYKLNFSHSAYGGKESEKYEFKKGKRYIFNVKVTR
ncbi:MAG: TonB family protein [Chlorobi bacterium]|nr:TonB family protein [Chlorobiota bacterium]